MAAREIRAAPRRLLLLTGSIAIGVAALVADRLLHRQPARLGPRPGPRPARRRLRAVEPPAAAAGGGARCSTRSPRGAARWPGSRASAAWRTCRAPAGPGWCRSPRSRRAIRSMARSAPSRPPHGASSRRAAGSWWIHRSSPRSAARRATRWRSARRGSSSAAWSSTRRANVGIRAALRAAHLHRRPRSRRDPAAGLRLARRVRGVRPAARRPSSPQQLAERYRPALRPERVRRSHRGRGPARTSTMRWDGSPATSASSGSSRCCSAASGWRARSSCSSGSGSTPSRCSAASARAPGWCSRSTPPKRRRWGSPAARSARRSASLAQRLLPALLAGLLPVDVAAGGVARRRGASASARGSGWRWSSR